MDKDLLVIGFGNSLRRDDGVGPAVAGELEELGLPGLRTIACTQLTPELSEPLSGARAAVFVDAAVNGPGRVRLSRLDPPAASQILAHAADPRALLALARQVFGRAPDAWMLTIPVDDLGYGEQLSPRARRGLRTAVRAVLALNRRLRVRDPLCPRP